MKQLMPKACWLAASLVFTGLAIFGEMFVFPSIKDFNPPGTAFAAARSFPAKTASADVRLGGAYRFDKGGWIYVHLAGSPEQIGYQHGSLLAGEIEDAFEAVKLDDTHMTRRDWDFFRRAAREMLWPRIEPEYQEELKGIVAGLKSKGKSLDIDDVVAMNAFEELPDY